jgi:alpha-amylase
VQLDDYRGHAGDVETDGAGRATITIPRNTNGLGYVCYSREGIGGPFSPSVHAVTQQFEGAADLDIPPADDTKFVNVGRVWAAAGKPIKGSLHFDATAWTGTTSITLELDSPSGAELASKNFVQSTPQGAALEATASATGYHTFRIRSSSTPAANRTPSYTLAVTYTATQNLNPGQ